MGASSVKAAFSNKLLPELSPEGPVGLRQAAEDSRGDSRRSESWVREKEKYGEKRGLEGRRKRTLAITTNSSKEFINS